MNNNWADLLAEARHSVMEKVPKGWLNVYDLRDKYFKGMTVQHVRGVINPLIGKTVERTKFRVRRIPGGYVRAIYHYKIK